MEIKKENDSVITSVKDKGQGIPAEDLPDIFKEFKTTSVKSTGGEKSTGLGLAIVKKIVDAHKGKTWVESEYGSGATFYFTLPC